MGNWVGKGLGKLGVGFGIGVREGAFDVNGYNIGFSLMVFDLVFGGGKFGGNVEKVGILLWKTVLKDCGRVLGRDVGCLRVEEVGWLMV